MVTDVWKLQKAAGNGGRFGSVRADPAVGRARADTLADTGHDTGSGDRGEDGRLAAIVEDRSVSYRDRREAAAQLAILRAGTPNLYVHFTDQAGAAGITESGQLWESSMVAAGDGTGLVYAVAVGGNESTVLMVRSEPGPDGRRLGRVTEARSVCVVFRHATGEFPDVAYPNELMWRTSSGGIPVEVIDVVGAEDGLALLDGSADIPDVDDLWWDDED